MGPNLLSRNAIMLLHFWFGQIYFSLCTGVIRLYFLTLVLSYNFRDKKHQKHVRDRVSQVK